MTMSKGDAHKGKKPTKKKAKKGGKPKDSKMEPEKVIKSKTKSKQLDKKIQETTVKTPPPPVVKNIPQPKTRKGKKRRWVEKQGSKEESMDVSTEGEQNEQLAEKEEKMDEGKTDGLPSAKKKKINQRKQGMGENEEDITMMEDNLENEKGKTGDEKPKRKGKNNQKRKKKNKAKQVNEQVQVDSQRFCLRYLQLWDKDRESWRFQKLRQVWLLQHMYDKTKVPKSEFHILLRYLENIQGKAREITIKQAEGLIEKHEDKMQNLEKSSDGEGDKKMKVEWRRASDILQTLS